MEEASVDSTPPTGGSLVKIINTTKQILIENI